MCVVYKYLYAGGGDIAVGKPSRESHLLLSLPPGGKVDFAPPERGKRRMRNAGGNLTGCIC